MDKSIGYFMIDKAYIDILNDEGFKEWSFKILDIEYFPEPYKFMDIDFIEIHKIRYAMNNDSNKNLKGFFIVGNGDNSYFVWKFKDGGGTELIKMFLVNSMNIERNYKSPIEALASALWFIYQDQEF